jgi:flavin-dependent dehydrogenase
VKICVLGCGPAGAVTALGLHELGYNVTVVGEPRPYPVTEGISARVCQALADNKLKVALSRVSSPVQRHARWNGESRAANAECLVYRPDFDRALLADLQDSGIDRLRGRVRRVERQGNAWAAQVDTPTDRRVVQSDFLVEARGRAAGFGGQARLRGPETVSVGLNWISEPDRAFTAVASVEDGWLWLARHGDGRLFSQFTTRSRHPGLSPKDNIPSLLDALLDTLEIPGVDISGRTPLGEAMSRSSTAILPSEPSQAGLLRVGDAAMAVDPLSGNGIFQSLSSALAAPAVINTVLKRPNDGEMALGFYRERLRHLFFRFARIGRDFYAAETRWAGHDFWEQRRQWPDANPAHLEEGDEVIGRAERPVIHHGFIEKREVVMTRDQPLGAAHVPSKTWPI